MVMTLLDRVTVAVAFVVLLGYFFAILRRWG